MKLNSLSDIIYTDFSKAFDQENRTLLKKLQLFEFSDSLLNWFQSFLSAGRLKIVKHLKISSTQFRVSLGVLQGGPLVHSTF